jgi:hypothetical protein
MLVLLMGGIYDMCLELIRGCMIYVPDFMPISSGIQLILRLLPQQFQRLMCWYYL